MEEDPLITPNRKESNGSDSGKKSRIKQPNREVVVEPALVMSSLIAFPMIYLSQLYIVAKTIEEKADEIHFNISSNPFTGNCGMNESSPAYLFYEDVQADAAKFNMYNGIVSGVPALFVSLFLGSYSDKKGRRYAIITPNIGNLLRTASYVIVTLLDLPLWCILIGSFLEGCCGTYHIFIMGCISYIADQTSPEKRQFRITIVELITFFSGILGPLGVGVVISRLGFLIPLTVVLAGNILLLLYAIFFIPETIIPEENVRFFDLDNIKKTVRLFTQENEIKRRTKICLLFGAFFLTVTVYHQTIDQLFELNTPLCWGAEMIGYFGATYIAVGSLGGMIASKLLKFCLKDTIIAIIAGIANVCMYTLRGFVFNTVMMFSTVIFAPLGVVFVPSMRTLLSKLVLPTQQGSMFGAMASAELLCDLLGKLTINWIYRETLDIYTGLVYHFVALIYAIASVLVVTYGIVILRERNISRRKYSNLIQAE